MWINEAPELNYMKKTIFFIIPVYDSEPADRSLWCAAGELAAAALQPEVKASASSPARLLGSASGGPCFLAGRPRLASAGRRRLFERPLPFLRAKCLVALRPGRAPERDCSLAACRPDSAGGLPQAAVPCWDKRRWWGGGQRQPQLLNPTDVSLNLETAGIREIKVGNKIFCIS